jgi:hypothetical protein
LIQDYFEVVKNPIDLSTIRGKLENGDYTDPWQYINDIQLMFDNAWLYNRKTSKVYKACSKVCFWFIVSCIDECSVVNFFYDHAHRGKRFLNCLDF